MILRYWKLISIGLIILGIVFSILFYYIADLRQDKAELTERVASYQEALEAAQKSAERQIRALQQSAEVERQRNEQLSDTKRRIEANEQEISCPVPDVIIDSLRM